MLARVGEIRMVVREQLRSGSRITFEARLRIVCNLLLPFWKRRNRLVCIGESALAVPSVAGSVMIPEVIVYGADGAPVASVVLAGVNTRGRHPFEVWQHVCLTAELLPVGSLMCPYDRRIVFCLEPCATLVRGNGQHLLQPLIERF